MTLKRSTKPYEERRPQTPAQERAFRVFRLRGLWWMAHGLTGWRRDALKALVDAEITSLGAEPEATRDLRRRAEYEARWAATHPETNAEPEFEEVPF